MFIFWEIAYFTPFVFPIQQFMQLVSICNTMEDIQKIFFHDLFQNFATSFMLRQLVLRDKNYIECNSTIAKNFLSHLSFPCGFSFGRNQIQTFLWENYFLGKLFCLNNLKSIESSVQESLNQWHQLKLPWPLVFDWNFWDHLPN